MGSGSPTTPSGRTFVLVMTRKRTEKVKGKQVERVPTGFPNVSLIKFEKRPNYYLRIYQPKTRRVVLRATSTAVLEKALIESVEVYQDYLQHPEKYATGSSSTLELLEEWIRDVELRASRQEIVMATAERKKHAIINGVIPFLQKKSLLRAYDIQPQKDFIDYPAYRRTQGLKHASIKTEIVILKEFVTWLHKKGMVKTSLVECSLPRQTFEAKASEESSKPFTEEMLESIFNYLNDKSNLAPTTREKVKWKQMIFFTELMLAGGFRTAELYHLTWADCQMKKRGSLVERENLVTVRKSKTGPREVVFISPILSTMRDYYIANGVTMGPKVSLWVNPDSGYQWNKTYFSKMFRQVLTDLGIGTDYRLYSYRHKHISDAIERGVPPYIIAKNVGNSESMIRSTYDHVLTRNLRGQLFADSRDEDEDRFESIVTTTTRR